MTTSTVWTAVWLTMLLDILCPALAQTPDYLTANRAATRAARARAGADGVAANNRCNGMSYGTGARSCGTATGGPVGGIGGRN